MAAKIRGLPRRIGATTGACATAGWYTDLGAVVGILKSEKDGPLSVRGSAAPGGGGGEVCIERLSDCLGWMELKGGKEGVWGGPMKARELWKEPMAEGYNALALLCMALMLFPMSKVWVGEEVNEVVEECPLELNTVLVGLMAEGRFEVNEAVED